MTSLLMYKAQKKNTTDVPFIIKSVENLGTCLNNMLKTGARIAASSNVNIEEASRVSEFVNNVYSGNRLTKQPSFYLAQI